MEVGGGRVCLRVVYAILTSASSVSLTLTLTLTLTLNPTLNPTLTLTLTLTRHTSMCEELL